jgi:hypothetical protein
MSTITDVTVEGIHVKRGDTVVVAPLPERMHTATKVTQGADGTLFLVDEGDYEWDDTLTEAELQSALAYEPPVVIDLDTLRDQLWQSFNAHGNAMADANCRTSIALIAANPDATEQQKSRAMDWGLWWNTLWEQYATLKAELIANQVYPTFDLSQNTPPWNIWEIADL